jgi:sporulation protein YlmC with PRC-barrel domain
VKLFVLAIATIVTLLAAQAQAPKEARLLQTVPAEAVTIQNYFEQDVYDAGGERIGQVVDLLVDKDGRIPVAMISTGSFLNLRRKVVAAPFDLLQLTTRNRRPYLILDATRKALSAAQGFRYNRTTERWERVDEEQ